MVSSLSWLIDFGFVGFLVFDIQTPFLKLFVSLTLRQARQALPSPLLYLLSQVYLDLFHCCVFRFSLLCFRHAGEPHRNSSVSCYKWSGLGNIYSRHALQHSSHSRPEISRDNLPGESDILLSARCHPLHRVNRPGDCDWKLLRKRPCSHNRTVHKQQFSLLSLL